MNRCISHVGALCMTAAFFALPLPAAVAELEGMASKSAMPVFKSANPKYAKMYMNEDGSKTISIALDESRGTGRGFDMLYVLDCDDQGNVLKCEQFQGSRKSDGDTAIYSFKPLNRNVAFKKGLAPGKVPFSLGIECRRTETKIPRVKGSKKLGTTDAPAREEVTEEFVFSAVVSMVEEKTEWSYMFSGKIPVTESLGGCTAVNYAEGSLTMKVNSARPDPKKQEVGIGIDFLVGDYTLACTKDGKGTPVAIEIKDDKGKRCDRNTVRMDDLEFEVKSRTRRVSTGGGAAGCAPGGG